MIQLISIRLIHKKWILVLFFITLLLSLVEIWTMNRLATDGGKISNLEKVKQSLTLENQVLSNQLAQKSSLKRIAEDAKNLGFERINNLQYIQSPDLALNK